MVQRSIKESHRITQNSIAQRASMASQQRMEYRKFSAQPNITGLPDNLKAGIRILSGLSLDHVSVHYNSPRPAELDALAYTQGSNIYIAPGQEHFLPHEAWHVVQQAQGRVKPTMQLKGVRINNDARLEMEADMMGEKVVGMVGAYSDYASISKGHFEANAVIQCGPKPKPKLKLRDVPEKIAMTDSLKKSSPLPDIFEKIIKAYPEYTEGPKELRGQKTNNILHTTNRVEVEPHEKCSKRKFARHLSTVIAYYMESKDLDYVEVQVGVVGEFNKEQKIYISCNKNAKALHQKLGNSINIKKNIADVAVEMQQKLNHIPMNELNFDQNRQKGHVNKFIDEIKLVKGTFEIVVAGRPGQHAETRIDAEICEPEAVYGGLRRPCVACTTYFKLVGREKCISQNNGQLWTTNNALKSLHSHSHSLCNRDYKDVAPNTYVQKNKNGVTESIEKARGHDTDSDDDYRNPPIKKIKK